MENIRIYYLAIKYWLSGDNWDFAVEYAESLVKGWKRSKGDIDEK